MHWFAPTIALCLLAETGHVLASAHHRRRDPLDLLRADGALRDLVPRDDFGRDASQLDPRDSPPITTVAECDEYDGYFYVTPQNYTWQLQCVTNYYGTVVSQENTANYSTCIGSCIAYNQESSPGACLAITFNGADDAATGLCTQFSDVSNVYLADEEGDVQDSALLILGPNGQIFATPQAVPTFSGEPSQAPTDVPVPTTTMSTTAAGSVTSTSSQLSSSSQVPITILGTATSITTVTSTSIVVSCSQDAPLCSSSSTVSTLRSSTSGPGNGMTSSTLSTSAMSVPQSTSALSSTIMAPPLSPSTTTSGTTSGAFTVDAIQITATTILPFTEYRVQVVEVCAATSAPCSQSTITSASVGYRTEISCSPGACSGIMLATDLTADFAATAICVAP